MPGADVTVAHFLQQFKCSHFGQITLAISLLKVPNRIQLQNVILM
jgi:hypothetical protein